MILSSPIFIFCFLPAVFILYRISENQKFRNILLCAASIVFYAFGQLKYVPLFLLSILMNYLFGLVLGIKKQHNRVVLFIAVITNLAILAVFKYSSEIGLTGIALPLGISFFTFQGMSYVIDVYREEKYFTRDFIKVFLYVSFFPRLAAGPIVKFHEIENQLDARRCTSELTLEGIKRFIIGFSEKMLLSDSLAHIADYVFNNGTGDFRLAWLGAVCYMLQIYYDFAGYSNMAIGIGKMFGFVFPENFDHPYGAFSIKEFWRKWHISLSSWFKEYVYIPLGGNRKGKFRAFLNRMLVFICTGIWHGANLTYLVWGLGHGILAGAEDTGIIPVKKMNESVFGKIIAKIYTLFSVLILFVIFRAESLGKAWNVISTMFTGGMLETEIVSRLMTPAAITVLAFAVLLSGNIPSKIKMPKSLQTAFCALLFVLSIMCMAKGNFVPFIYSQF